MDWKKIMLKPQKKKYRIFARNFDRKPEIKEYDQLDEVITYMEQEKWITISIEKKLEKIFGVIPENPERR